jgi:hypothetical protein
MTYFLATTGPDANVYSDPDERNLDKMGWSRHQTATSLWQAWPRRSGLLGGAESDGPLEPALNFEMDSNITVWTGTASGFVISGITKDANDVALAAVTVKAYRTSADVTQNLPADLQEGPVLVSNADGAYAMPLPNADAHYLVGYLAGSPDVAGTTLNTLVGV